MTFQYMERISRTDGGVHFITKLIGSFCFTGFFPVAPATFASLVFAVAYAFVPGGTALAHPFVVLATLFVSVPVAARLEKRYGHDAGCIVIDEVVGMQMVFVWAEPSLHGLALGFFFFRVFDVLKPFPIDRSQDLPGGFGVVCDDVLAGIYTRVIVILIALVYPHAGRFV
jgi:phosphatidylglycerophosphatase A